MSASSDRPIEYAMTHWAQHERCLRPKDVRAMAVRLQKWAGHPETCQSCSARPAVSLRAGLPLCSHCRDEHSIRNGLVDASGLKPRAARAEPDDLTDMELGGLAIVFNSKSNDLGGFREIIKPSAVDRTLAEGIDLRTLWNHNQDLTIGRISAGTMRAKKMPKGLAVEVNPPRWASAYVESVARRDIQGQSFGFRVVTDDWHLEDEEAIREVLDMTVFETSFVSFPAYPATTAHATKGGQRSWIETEQKTGERLRLAR